MGKIVLSPETKAKITATTGLTFLADNIERNCDSSEGIYIRELLNFYSTTLEAVEKVKNIVEPAIKADCPEINFEPDKPVEKVTLTIIPTPEDALVKINDVEQKSITVNKGTSIKVNVEKEGYKPFEENVVVNTTENKEVVLVEKVKPELTTTLNDLVEKDVPTEFTVSSIANDHKNEVVKGKITIQDSSKIKLEYLETAEEEPSYHEMIAENNIYTFGPQDGFPCIDGTSSFRITGLEQTLISATISLVKISGEELASKQISFEIVDTPKFSN